MNTQLAFRTITREALVAKMSEKGRKLQLWNVLPRKAFNPEENIPGSKWLPVDLLEEMIHNVNVRPDDEVILYCGGTDCSASKLAAEILSRRGFTNLELFEGGLKSWKEAAMPMARVHSTPEPKARSSK